MMYHEYSSRAETASNLAAVFASSAQLLAQGLSIRAEEPADEAALCDLYIRHRWREFESVPLPDIQKTALLAQQFAIQSRQYRANYQQPSFMVLTGAVGIGGRLYLDEQEDDVRIIDILLDAPLRGRGIGGALMRALISAIDEQRNLSLQVIKDNPAHALYRRLDFIEIADLGHAWLMRRRGGATTTRPPVPSSTRKGALQ